MPAQLRLSHELMALRVARELHEGMVATIGYGLPTLISNYVPQDGSIILHSENGMLGFGPNPMRGEANPDLVNASGQPVTLLPGAAVFDCAEAFAMIRGGHIDVAVMGALQVSERGDLANWRLPGRRLGSPGGAVDLAAGARRIIVMMEHTTRDKLSRLVRSCDLPITGLACVDLVVTDVAVIRVTPSGLILTEVAPGWSPADVQALTEPRLQVAPDFRDVFF